MSGQKEEFTPRESPESVPSCAPERPLPEEPTKHPPGSPEKIAVMRQRYLARRQLFHPQDARVLGRREAPRVGSKASGSYPGVDRKKGKWRARVWDPVKKQTVLLGLYQTEQEAVQAVEEARRGLAG